MVVSRDLSPQVVGTYALINPIVAMGLGQFYLGESLTHEMLISAMLVLGGVGLIILSNYNSAKPAMVKVKADEKICNRVAS